MKNTVAASAYSTQKSKRLWAERDKVVPKAIYPYTHLFIDSASNATVRDVDGNTYIDFTGGIGTLNVGHCHPKVIQAVEAQLKKFLHICFHVCAYEGYIRVAERLCELMPGSFPKKAVLFNSGAEAVENAVKAARGYTKRAAVISFDYAFHGRTYLALSLTGKYKPYRWGLGPYPTELYRAPYPYPYRPPYGVDSKDVGRFCLDQLEKLFVTSVGPEHVAAIIVEAVQGEGGFVVPTPDFLPALRRICDKHGICLILDEIQTGFGRTGKMFAVEHFGVVPDLMTVAKSIGAGLPLSGVVGRAEILDCVEEGGMGGTYGGNPVSCAAALAVFEVFERENLVARSEKLGKLIAAQFDQFQKDFDFVGESRGLGCMRAIELVVDRKTKEPVSEAAAKKLLEACSSKGLLILKAGVHNNVIRTLVPLTIPEPDLAKGLDILEQALKDFNPK